MKRWYLSALYFAVVVVTCVTITLLHSGSSIAYSAVKNSNYGLAVAIWRLLALLGDPNAQYDLALSYTKGRGVPIDMERGMYWYSRAARNGLADAQYNLAEYLRTGNGIAQDKEKAVFWLRKAAEQNHQSAQNNLGMMYAEGNGTPRDLVQAAMWFSIAIANESKTSEANLQRLGWHMTPEQVTEAMKKVVQWRSAHQKSITTSRMPMRTPEIRPDSASR